MTADEWQIVGFTVRVAGLPTLLILPPGLLLAWMLARYQWPGKSLVETLVALPLVMPPVATGLILLKVVGRRGPLGRFLHDTFGIDVVFTWRAVVLAMAVMSFPLLVRSARVAFEGVPIRLEQIARTLGAGELAGLLHGHAAARRAGHPRRHPARLRPGSRGVRRHDPGGRATSRAGPRRSRSPSTSSSSSARTTTAFRLLMLSVVDRLRGGLVQRVVPAAGAPA